MVSASVPEPALQAAQPGHPMQPVVFVVDDDDHMRAAVRRVLTNADFAIEAYASGAEFLANAHLPRPGCLILDFKMPGMNGLEVQAALKERGVELPIIFLTGSSDVPIAVTAMREGAIDFLEKPFDNAALLERVHAAIERNLRWWRDHGEREALSLRLASLTARERSVFDLVVEGNTNKEIARKLGASYRTIEIHRRRVMEKMGAQTLAQLVRMRPQAKTG